MQFCLRVTHGAELGLVHTIGAAPVIVGTSASSDVCLSDRSVSRAHCQLFAREGECVIRDLGSTNGTYLDGEIVVEARFPVGSRLRLGTTELLLEQRPETGLASAETVEFGDLVGRSRVMTQLFAELRAAASSSRNVLLLGDAGTGKELAARAMHARSDRSARPFVVVSCAGVGAQFLEDKLFGHDEGALPGATAAVAGVFEQAGGGSVFLEDVGELQPELQARLLDMLERRELSRIGSNVKLPFDVRLFAATPSFLSEMVRRGTFRADLFQRMSEVTLRIPSLRERAEDIAPISHAILAREGFGDRKLSSDAIAYLQQLRWPGNVRELRNLLRRAALLTNGPIIDQQLLEDLASTTAEVQVTREQLDALAARQAALDPAGTLQPTTARMQPSAAAAPRGTPSTNEAELDSFTTPEIEARPSAAPGPDCARFDLPLEQSIESHRKAYVQHLQLRFGVDVRAAAAHAGIHPRALARMYRQYRNRTRT